MRDDMLARLRRYQHLLIMGGGALITVFMLLACVLQIWTSVSSYIAAAKDEMSMTAHRAEDAMLRVAAAMRNDVRTIASAWAEVATARASDDGLRDSLLVEAVAGARASTDWSVYLLDAELQPLIVSTEPGQGSRWADIAMADREGAVAALSSVVGPYLPPLQGMPFLIGGPLLHWLPPRASPVTGQQVVCVVAIVPGFEGRLLGSLLFEQKLSSLAAIVAWDRPQGEYLVLDEKGAMLLPSGESVSADILPAAHQALERGLGRDVRSLYQDGYLLTSWGLEPTPWRLVYALSLRSIVAGVAAPAATSVLTGVLITLVAWLLLLTVKRKVFLPALAQSQRVFESEQLSRVLVDTVPVGLGLIAIGTGQPLLRSTAMEEMEARATVPRGNLSAELCAQFLHYEAQGDVAHGPLNVGLSLVTRTGTPLELSVSLARARYKGEDALVVSFTDVTAQKQAERALHEARQAADSANAAKSAFLAAMSHEIRTPLNAIQGNLELLTHSPLDPVQRDRLSTIRSASDDLLSTVSDVLDFSKIEAGELRLELASFDVNEIAARALIMFAPLARTKGLLLVGEFGLRPRQIMRGDSARLAQVLNNLLSNALKFTDSGRVTMSVALESEGRRLLVTVADTGIGMSTGQMAGLFRAFSQADNTINRRFGGTGLGLALCARLARAMGGAITATSEPGQGSRFMLRLPLGEAPTREPLPKFSGERVVLVADDTGAHVARALSAWGLCPEVCNHVGQIGPAQLDNTQLVILWGDRRALDVAEENRLVEEAPWVIDCRSDGPSRPLVMGRLISVSVYGLQSLLRALEYTLWRRVPDAQASLHYVLARRLKVLVVEDHPATRRLLQEQLTLLGCEVRVLPDGEQALRNMESSPCEVLLTDLAMPGMDGHELVRRVRESWPWVPVLVVTADVTPQKVRCFAHDARTRVLGKPLTLDALRKALSQVSGVEPVENESTLGEDLLGGKPMPDDLRETFQAANAASLAIMHQAWEGGDVARLLAELHAVQGALGVFGMEQLAEQGAELSRALKSGEMQSCQTRFTRFCFELRRLSNISGPQAGAV